MLDDEEYQSAMKLADQLKKKYGQEMQKWKNFSRKTQKTLEVREGEIENMKVIVRKSELRTKKIRTQKLLAIKTGKTMKKKVAILTEKLEELCTEVNEAFYDNQTKEACIQKQQSVLQVQARKLLKAKDEAEAWELTKDEAIEHKIFKVELFSFDPFYGGCIE